MVCLDNIRLPGHRFPLRTPPPVLSASGGGTGGLPGDRSHKRSGNGVTIKNLLTHTRMYLLFQWLVGGLEGRRICVRDYMDYRPGLRILDIGCGPGYIVESIPECDYVGYDIDPTYIEHAKRHHGGKGSFFCKVLTTADLEAQPPFDVIFLHGVLHHLDDGTAREVLDLARAALKTGGCLLTLDGYRTADTTGLGRWMLDNDRGRHVRSREAYLELVGDRFHKVEPFLRHDLFRVSYPNLIMKCHA